MRAKAVVGKKRTKKEKARRLETTAEVIYEYDYLIFPRRGDDLANRSAPGNGLLSLKMARIDQVLEFGVGHRRAAPVPRSRGSCTGAEGGDFPLLSLDARSCSSRGGDGSFGGQLLPYLWRREKLDQDLGKLK